MGRPYAAVGVSERYGRIMSVRGRDLPPTGVAGLWQTPTDIGIGYG